MNSNISNNIINKYFKNVNNGVYIECGAVDGIHRSITLPLYNTRGWVGYNFEPNPHNFSDLQKNRPKDTNLNFALSNDNIIKEFTVPKGDVRGYKGGNSGFDIDVNGRDSKKYDVNTITFDKFVDQYNVEKIDFMVLDVEGHELDVLERFAEAKVLPKILLIEVYHINKKGLNNIIKKLKYKKDENIDVGFENELFILN